VWTEIPQFCVRDCSCFWGSPSNDGSFSKTSERLGSSSEANDSPASPLLTRAARAPDWLSDGTDAAIDNCLAHGSALPFGKGRVP
jgi:hypothetical protein